ncbi:hypothetical protein OEZ85_002727 [Tetradesmus obliquus]|uniref:Uncharacterized protein n=1 Tax=Tetradesmus obliquus TaxID=3088 RepID=A0ABY8TYF0_TETOB|nr:hypothetical protein OEZ85_002727 [Tetradesmus obliquus]
MEEALRYNQHLQFCKQLQALQRQLCEETQLSSELLSSLYALGKYHQTPASCLTQLAAAFPEFAAKLQRSVKPHPLKELHVEQLEGDAVEAVMANAENFAMVLQPMYKALQELGKFMVRASGLLADLHQLLITVTMATAPQVIEFFMTLFCNTTRIVLLMERVPWRLLVQVYTIVTATLNNSSPPGRTAVCELLEKLQEPVAYMQELFQPISSRVSQILELAVSAVLDHVPTARVLECSSVFDVSRLGQTQLGITGLSLQRTYSFLQRLDDFRSWAQLGFLACPAALQGDDASLLPEALPMALAAQAYAKSELLWYFRHVAEKLPGASAAAGSGASKLGLPLLAEKPSGPQLTEDAHVVTLVAATTAVYDLLEEHQEVLQGCQLATMRALLEQQVLPETAAVLATADRNAQVIPTTGKDRVVPRILVPLVKAVVYPLAELAHAEDATLLLGRPESPVQYQQADSSMRRQSTTTDASSAAARDSEGGSEAAAADEAVSSGGGSSGGATTASTARVSSTDEAALATTGAAVSTSSHPAAVLQAVQQSMVYLTMLLSSRNLWMRPAVLEAPAQDPQYLEAIHRLLELFPFATAFLPALERSCCLNHLAFYQDKLLRLQRYVLAASSLAAREALAGCPSLIKVLHWFEHNLPVVAADGDGGRDYGAEAKLLACRLLEEQCGTVALMLTSMSKELRNGLYVTHSSAGFKFSKRASSFADSAAADTAAARDMDAAPVSCRGAGLPGATQLAGGAAAASVRSRAVALAHALDRVGPVRVSSDRLVMPVEYLRAALQQCLLLQINEMVMASDVPPVPSQLVRILHDLLWATAELHQVLCIDVRPELWQVLLNHAQPDWVLPPTCTPSASTSKQGPMAGAAPQLARASRIEDGQQDGFDGPGDAATQGAAGEACSSSGIPVQLHGMVLAYGEWYVNHVVRDGRGLGVLYAPQLRRFTCVRGAQELIQTRTSLQELTALLQMFGPYAALKLAELSEGVVLDCLSQLDECLARWKELLDPVTMAVVRDDSCADAVAAACAGLADEGQVLTQARQLSRCLAFRQLLGEALAQALGSTFPVVAATVDAVASNVALDVVGSRAGGCADDAAAAAAAAGGVLRDVSALAGGSELVAGRHLSDVFELPRPGLQGVGSPAVADPIVVNTLVGSNNYERYKAWFNLPSLLGLTLNSATISTTSLALAEHSMANELHALVHAAKCLALAQQQAANRVLTCGSRFLHPEAEDQAGDMLACFAKVAATTLYGRNDAVGVRTVKQLLLESLACPQLPASQLSDAWLPTTRLRSGLCQASL